MKTTFSYFPGMFENPAPEKYYFIKTKSKTFWNINYIRIRRKIIDDYRLLYLSDLLKIKLIFFKFKIRVECCTFLNLYGRYVLQYKPFFNNFLLIDAKDRINMSSNHHRISLYPLSFFANTLFKNFKIKYVCN